jgi:hypothetical protein
MTTTCPGFAGRCLRVGTTTTLSVSTAIRSRSITPAPISQKGHSTSDASPLAGMIIRFSDLDHPRKRTEGGGLKAPMLGFSPQVGPRRVSGLPRRTTRTYPQLRGHSPLPRHLAWRSGADELACKPDPVPGRLAAARSAAIHLDPPLPTGSVRPTRRHRAGSPRAPAVWPCSGWGLPSHPGHPGCWWSLTPPFHPYSVRLRAGAVCFLWHCPASRPGLLLTTTLPCGVRTFLGDTHRCCHRPASTRPPGQLVRTLSIGPAGHRPGPGGRSTDR